MKVLSAAIITAALSGSAASAVTFDLWGTGGDAGSYTFNSGGVELTVTAGLFDDSYNVLSTNSQLVGQYAEFTPLPKFGLGVSGPCTSIVIKCLPDDDTVDGAGSNELLVFTFDPSLSSFDAITFAFSDPDDDFVFFADTGSGLVKQFEASTNSAGFLTTQISDFSFGTTFGGATFAIGAKEGGLFDTDDFLVKQLTVTPVPLPAAGWLLLAGVGGLAAASRRKKRAA